MPNFAYAVQETTQSESSYEQKLIEKMKTAEEIARKEIANLHKMANSTNSPDERNIRGFVLSTEVRTFKDIQKNVDQDISFIRQRIRTLIFHVATDIELSGKSGKVVIGPGGILGYDDLPENTIKKYESLMEAKMKNNISIRSVHLAIQLLASLNKRLIVEAEGEGISVQLKRKLYITQAAYVYEMANIVLEVLNKVSLEGKPMLEAIKQEHEQRIKKRISEMNSELKEIIRLKEAGIMTDNQVISYQKSYAFLKAANQTSLNAWEDLMKKVSKQENWLNKMKQQQKVVEAKMKLAKHQLQTLRDIIVIGEMTSMVDNMDDLVATIQDLELLELDEKTVRGLLFINFNTGDDGSEPKILPVVK
ncbi:hypothetical protein BGP_1956 [Beggiatoa sp. PS]|nr:hypothetical protein BGP_1956 [Beggiatoa sp. PS]